MKTEFHGILANHRAPRKMGIIESEIPSARGGLLRQWALEDIEKLNKLSEHYGTQRGDYFSLCLKLAVIGVPAFQEKPSRGRVKKWSPTVISILVVEMENKIEANDPQKGAAWAARVIAVTEPWKSFLETRETDLSSSSGNPSEALRKKYFEHCEGGHEGLRRMRKTLNETGQMEIWNDLVRQAVKN